MASQITTAWLVDPAASDNPGQGYVKIQDVKSTFQTILNYEHDVDAGDALLDQGIHRPGSAVAFYQAAAPTTRLNGQAFTTAADNGRLWVDSDDMQLYCYVAGTFTKVNSAFSGTTITASGNATIGGTLGVTGATTLSSTCAITGNTTIGGTCGITGNTTIGGTLGITGATTITGALTVSGKISPMHGNYIGGAKTYGEWYTILAALVTAAEPYTVVHGYYTNTTGPSYSGIGWIHYESASQVTVKTYRESATGSITLNSGDGGSLTLNIIY